jgi:superfamily II DNA helicase RecQ
LVSNRQTSLRGGELQCCEITKLVPGRDLRGTEIDPVQMINVAFAKLANVSSGVAPTAFKSREQAEAFMIMARRNRDALIVLPTGSGKSLPYQMLHLVEGGLVTVLLVTIKPALEDQMRRLRELNIPHQVYDPTEVRGQEDVAIENTLLLVQVENIKNEAYWNLINGLEKVKRLGRVVIDEVHLVETHSEFREFGEHIGRHANYRCPIVGMSATVPPCREGSLMTTLNIAQALTLRRSSDRPELKFNSIMVKSVSEIPKQVATTATEWNLKPEQRGIVYVMTKKDVITVHEHLNKSLPASCGGVFLWTADMSSEKGREQVCKWQESDSAIIVATTGLLMGIDHHGVAGVVFAYGAYSLEDVQQGAGRAARCREVVNIGYVTMIHAGGLAMEVRVKGEKGAEDIRRVRELMTSNDMCRRYIITSHCDGVGITCNAVPMSEYCDVCESLLPSRVGAGHSPAGNAKMEDAVNVMDRQCTKEEIANVVDDNDERMDDWEIMFNNDGWWPWNEEGQDNGIGKNCESLPTLVSITSGSQCSEDGVRDDSGKKMGGGNGMGSGR